jgi:hypothetical protein
LLAVREYVWVPATAEEAWHCTPVHVTPDHAKFVGLPVHEADNTMDVPISGALSLAKIEQLGIGSGVPPTAPPPPPPPPPPPAPCFHSTSTATRGPVPALLMPSTEYRA